MSPKKYEVIIVGSGPAGVHAAWPLVTAGVRVALIDAGFLPASLSKDFKGSFDSLRQDEEQYKLFLGENLSGILPPAGKQGHSSMRTTGRWAYVTHSTDDLLPIQSKNIQVLQSLARGGLSEVWGASCEPFSTLELEQVGLPPALMQKHYQRVIDRIGVCGVSEHYVYHPPANVDHNARAILKKYLTLNKLEKFSITKPTLALLTKKLNDRMPTNYGETQYWLDEGKSVYRARYTLQELQKYRNFTYISGSLVNTIKERDGEVLVSSQELAAQNKKISIHRARYVVCAAGAINTSRILLRSYEMFNTPVPFMTKSHVLLPCLHPTMLGKAESGTRHSLCQLFIKDMQTYKHMQRSFSQIYSYHSLLLFKLLEFSPASAPESLGLLNMLASAFVIVDVRVPSFLTHQTTIALKKDQKEHLSIESTSAHDSVLMQEVVGDIRRLLRQLNVFALRTIHPQEGSTAHYAGGIPFRAQAGRELSTDHEGRLHQGKRIYIADAASWRALPAKPPALTIMANADRIGSNVLIQLKKDKKQPL